MAASAWTTCATCSTSPTTTSRTRRHTTRSAASSSIVSAGSRCRAPRRRSATACCCAWRLPSHGAWRASWPLAAAPPRNASRPPTRPWPRASSPGPSGGDDRAHECSEVALAVGRTGKVLELCQREVAVAPSLRQSVLPRPAALEDRQHLRHLVIADRLVVERDAHAVVWPLARVDLAQSSPVGISSVRQRPHHREGLLALPDVARLRLARLRGCPEAALDVIGHLEGHAEVVAEPTVGLHDFFIIGGEDGSRLDRCAEQGGGLLADHLEVGLDADLILPLEGDVQVLALAQRQAGLVVDAHQPEDTVVAEPVLEEPIQGEAAEREQRVAGVDGERYAPDRPQRGPMPPFEGRILDVVVHQAEVVTQLDSGRTR